MRRGARLRGGERSADGAEVRVAGVVEVVGMNGVVCGARGLDGHLREWFGDEDGPWSMSMVVRRRRMREDGAVCEMVLWKLGDV